MRWFSALPVLLAAMFGASCKSAPDPVAFQNRVFYHYSDVDADPSAFEQRYPPLDFSEQPPNPAYLGYTLIGKSIHVSRPRNWVLRRASNQPEERFVEYISPNQYVFSIYERVDSPSDLWRDVIDRYEADAKEHGADLVGARVPFATWNAQGRGYLVKRLMPGAKAPYRNFSREVLLRSDHRIVLAQVVYPTETIQPLSEELMRVFQTLAVD